jgi:hypothetical protein
VNDVLETHGMLNSNVDPNIPLLSF